jgi:hypothetical protein
MRQSRVIGKKNQFYMKLSSFTETDLIRNITPLINHKSPVNVCYYMLYVGCVKIIKCDQQLIQYLLSSSMTQSKQQFPTWNYILKISL